MEDMGGEWVVMEKASGSDRDSPCRCTAKEACTLGPVASFSFTRLDILFCRMRKLGGGIQIDGG